MSRLVNLKSLLRPTSIVPSTEDVSEEIPALVYTFDPNDHYLNNKIISWVYYKWTIRVWVMVLLNAYCTRVYLGLYIGTVFNIIMRF